MKKRQVIYMLFIILFVIMFIFSFYLFQKNRENDSIKFKNEYESLNDKITNGKKYLELKISSKNNIHYASYKEVIEVLNGTGVIYFGFPECPWCRNIIPILLDVAEEMGLEQIYYYNAYPIRDQKELDQNGNIVVKKEGTKEYYDLVKKLDSVLNPYDGLNDNSIKRLYFPTVVFVRDGKIIGIHEGTVDSQTDPYTPLTTEQQEELKIIYMNLMEEVIKDMCGTKC